MAKKSPSERGYHPVMLRQSTFERLQGVGAGLSADGAVIRLLDEAYNTPPDEKAEGVAVGSDALELLMRMAKVPPEVAQRMREARELM